MAESAMTRLWTVSGVSTAAAIATFSLPHIGAPAHDRPPVRTDPARVTVNYDVHHDVSQPLSHLGAASPAAIASALIYSPPLSRASAPVAARSRALDVEQRTQ